MPRSEIRFGIVGCGAIAQRHAEIIDAAEDLSLAAVCDTNQQARESLAATFRVPRIYPSLAELLDARCCDVVTICTPSGSHGEMIEAAAAAGVHVLVEKPLEVSLVKADSAIRACREAHVRLGVIYQRRGLELFRRTLDAVASGRLGSLALAEASVKWYRPAHYYDPASWHASKQLEGGGALANQGVHGIDAVQWVAGGVESVKANIATRVHRIDAEDTAVVAVRYRNGAIGTIIAATSSFPGEPLTFGFHGSQGTIIIQNEKIVRWVVEGVDRTGEMKTTQERWPETKDRYAGHRALVLDMADAVRENRDPIVHGLIGRESVAILEATYKSARSGREILVESPPPDLTP